MWSKAGLTTFYPSSSALNVLGSIWAVDFECTPVVTGKASAVDFVEALGTFCNTQNHRPWNILGLVVSKTADAQRVQVVVDYAESDTKPPLGQDLDGFCEEFAAWYRDQYRVPFTIKDGSAKWWMLTKDDARYWLPEGGGAILWTYVKDKPGGTKNMKSPMPGQLLGGSTLSARGLAKPLTDSDPGLTPASPPDGGDEGEGRSYWPIVVVGVGLLIAGAYAASRSEKVRSWHTKW